MKKTAARKKEASPSWNDGSHEERPCAVRAAKHCRVATCR